MLFRIEVISTVEDARASIRLKKWQQFSFTGKIKNLFLTDNYTVDKKFSPGQIFKIAELITNPVTQKYLISPIPTVLPAFDWAIEVGYLPGVTDNVANTVKEMISDYHKTKFRNGEGVYSSRTTFINGQIAEKDVKILADSLYNPLIQLIKIKNFRQFVKEKGMSVSIPKVKLAKTSKVTAVNLQLPDEELEIIGKSGIANADGQRRGPLALSLSSMKAIQDYFKKMGRNPTDIEIESLAQTWSEHCKHTIFADPLDDLKDGLFKTYIKGATDEIRKKKGKKDFCVSVFQDNSGAIAFDENYLITHKVETHNSPSALDPFGGAITGIVGVNRDTIGFGLGAKPVANIYGFCFADPRKDVPLYKGKNFTQKMLSSRRIMDGVIEGVNAGGNQSGIPTPLGFLFFDERFRGKPLVFVGTVGLIPKKIKGTLSYQKKAKAEDYIVIVGGRVGKDGVHGATFSSEALDAGSPVSAVQIGDPITQKKFSDALVKEARDLRLYHSITDNGAGGLSCSVAEMAKESGGCLVDIEKVPLKYPGLSPWEIWISESQERMTLAVPPGQWKKLNSLLTSRGVEATVIGKFTASGKCLVKYKGKTIMDIDLKFLHDGRPVKKLTSSFKPLKFPEPLFPDKKNFTADLLSILKRLNIGGFSFISQQYDHLVQASSVLLPLQGRGRINSTSAVFRPILSSQKGVVLSYGLYPTYGDIDPYHMAASAIDTAVRSAIVAGADPDHLALLDNFCWCSSYDPKRLGQLKRAVKACYDYAVLYGTPFISGKDSMFNDFDGFDKNGRPVKISIPPTLLI
ncbi:phosphoribosylformylglycinamidine synthase, partial [Candidatus Gottesmanbacteria bacterium RBG_16_37_8]